MSCCACQTGPAVSLQIRGIQGRVQAKASAQVKGLLNRLNNAVKQRNATHEEA
jgi:hypothetical protein